jgi:hypothetical protein
LNNNADHVRHLPPLAYNGNSIVCSKIKFQFLFQWV